MKTSLRLKSVGILAGLLIIGNLHVANTASAQEFSDCDAFSQFISQFPGLGNLIKCEPNDQGGVDLSTGRKPIPEPLPVAGGVLALTMGFYMWHKKKRRSSQEANQE